MKTFTVYLGGPINGCTDDEASNWRDEIIKLWNDPGNLEFCNPMSRDYRGIEGDHTNEIVDLDKRDIRYCDALLMYAPKPSAGTSMEILYGFMQEKPIVVVVPEGVPVSPWVKRHATKIEPTTEQAMAWIYNTFSCG